jgi:hypothetical protein
MGLADTGFFPLWELHVRMDFARHDDEARCRVELLRARFQLGKQEQCEVHCADDVESDHAFVPVGEREARGYDARIFEQDIDAW